MECYRFGGHWVACFTWNGPTGRRTAATGGHSSRAEAVRRLWDLLGLEVFRGV